MRIARVVNPSLTDGGKPFKGKYAGEIFNIDPGTDTLIPFDALVLWAGDPNARNIDERRKFRTGEFQRVRVKYGAYEREDLWERQKPTIQFFTHDTGERIWTVLDDPDGVMGTLKLTTEQDAQVALMRTVEEQGKQLDAINELIRSGKLVVAGDYEPVDHSPDPDLSAPENFQAQLDAEAEFRKQMEQGHQEGQVGHPTIGLADETTQTAGVNVDDPANLTITSEGDDEDEDDETDLTNQPATPPEDNPSRVRVGSRPPADQ